MGNCPRSMTCSPMETVCSCVLGVMGDTSHPIGTDPSESPLSEPDSGRSCGVTGLGPSYPDRPEWWGRRGQPWCERKQCRSQRKPWSLEEGTGWSRAAARGGEGLTVRSVLLKISRASSKEQASSLHSRSREGWNSTSSRKELARRCLCRTCCACSGPRKTGETRLVGAGQG